MGRSFSRGAAGSPGLARVLSAHAGSPRTISSRGQGWMTAGAPSNFCRRRRDPWPPPWTKAPAILTNLGTKRRGWGRTEVLTFPEATVQGSAPLHERARNVELDLSGQGRRGHSILVQPKSTAASRPCWARLLCGRPRGQACVDQTRCRGGTAGPA